MDNTKMTNRSLRCLIFSAKRRLIGFAIALSALMMAAGSLLFFENAPAEAQEVNASQKKALEVKSIRLLTAGEGWVSGEKQLLWTVNAGRNWTDRTPPLSDSGIIKAVFFLNTEKGWAITSRNNPDNETRSGENTDLQLSITSDGGLTWATKSLLGTGKEEIGTVSVDFTDARHGWVSARLPSNSNFSRGLLLRTDDGGQTWNKLPAPPIGDPVNFVSATEGWLAGGPGGDQLYVTRDGGRSWKRQAILPPTADYRSAGTVYHLPSFQNAREGILPVTFTGENSSALVFYKTRDGGESWNAGNTLSLSGGVDADEAIAFSFVDSETIITGLPKETGLTFIEGKEQRRSNGVLQNLSADAAVTLMDFKSSTEGWLLTTAGRCAEYKSRCTQETKLLATSDGGLTTIDVTPQVISAEPQSPGAGEDEAVGITRSKGFDKCTVASVGNMQSWYTNTPWLDTNIYIGGSNRGCSQPLLTSSWISQVRGQGWKFIPTWVGPQAPGSSCSSCGKMSTNSTTARSQGRTEADSATNAANALGLSPQTIIYYDMEQYTTTATGRAAVKAFIDGWVTRLNERGNEAGVYGSAANALDDWHGAGVLAPRAVWIAKWDNRETVFGLTPLPDNLWASSQRIHQYRGGHNETWGGVTFNIDSNILDGPVEDR